MEKRRYRIGTLYKPGKGAAAAYIKAIIRRHPTKRDALVLTRLCEFDGGREVRQAAGYDEAVKVMDEWLGPDAVRSDFQYSGD